MALWWDEYFSYPENNLEVPIASIASVTDEVAVEYNQGCPALDPGDEFPQPLDFDYAPPVAAITNVPIDFQLSPQYNASPCQVSHVRLSVIRAYANVFYSQPLGAREHTNIRDLRGHGNNRRHGVRSKAKFPCVLCTKKFGRIQELKRHQKEVHGPPPRQCPFCTFRWNRPGKIKQHITSYHRDIFTAKLLGDFNALRGKGIVAFLSGYYDFGLEVGAMPPNTASSLDFPFSPALM